MLLFLLLCACLPTATLSNSGLLSPISRFLLTLPEAYPSQIGPFTDASDAEISTLNKQLKSKEGGVGGIAAKLVRSGGRGSSPTYSISSTSSPLGRFVRVAERNVVVLLGNMLCDFLDPHYTNYGDDDDDYESPVSEYEVLKISPCSASTFPSSSPLISCTIYSVPSNLYPSAHLKSYISSFSQPTSSPPPSNSTETTLICVFHSTPLPVLQSLRHLVLNPLSSTSSETEWGKGVKTIKDEEIKTKIGAWGFGHDYVLRRTSWSVGNTTTPNSTLSKVFSTAVSNLIKSTNATTVLLTGHGLSAGIAGILGSASCTPRVYAGIGKPWYTKVPNGYHSYLLSPPPLFSSSLPVPFVTSVVHGTDVLPRCTVRSVKDARDGKTGVKEGVRLHAEGMDDGSELCAPGRVYYLTNPEKSGGYSQVNRVGRRGTDLKAEGIWGVRRIVGKESAVEDGRYESYRRALDKGEMGVQE